MSVPFLDLKITDPHQKAQILDQYSHIINNAAFIGGEIVQTFEKKFADYCGGGHCVSVGNGTDALILALRALDIGPNDEVITVPFTFIATAEAIGVVGAKVKFIDIDPKTYTIDVNLLEKSISPKTKVIIPVHIFGQPADMDPINELAKKKGIHVIEDAAQAHGAEYKKKRVGTLCDIGCFSFYPTKNLGGFGDGGAITTLKKDLADKIRQIANHGRRESYFHEREGINSRLDALQAAVLTQKLESLDENNKRRRHIAEQYSKICSQNSFVTPPTIAPYAHHVFHLYCLESSQRDEMMRRLRSSSIGTGIYYDTPLHLQPAYAHLGHKKGDFPISERASERIFSLPMYPGLKDDQVQAVCDVLSQFNPVK